MYILLYHNNNISLFPCSQNTCYKYTCLLKKYCLVFYLYYSIYLLLYIYFTNIIFYHYIYYYIQTIYTLLFHTYLYTRCFSSTGTNSKHNNNLFWSFQHKTQSCLKCKFSYLYVKIRLPFAMEHTTLFSCSINISITTSEECKAFVGGSSSESDQVVIFLNQSTITTVGNN